MKNIVFTLRFIPLVMLVTLSWSVSGQTIIKEISSVPSQQSIIRNYTDSVDIVYCDSKDSACFMYVDHATNSVKCTRLPDDVKVNDFEIDQRELYFCGNKLDSGFVGIFDINDYFFGMGTIRQVCLNNPIVNGHNSDYITNLKKIDYAYYDSELHLIMVGEGYHNETKPAYHDCIVDMWSGGTVNAQFKYTMDYTDYLSYDDVAVTDHYVVVSAHGISAINPLAHFLLPYNKPSTSGVSIFVTSPITTVTANMTDYAVIGAYNGNDIQIKSMGKDSVATVCDGLVFLHNRHSVIVLYEDPLNMPFRRVYFNLQTDTNYIEIAYNRKNRYLYMIPNLAENAYYTIPPYDTVIDAIYSGTKWLSIDRNVSNKTMTLSGYNTMDGKTITMQYDPANDSACVRRDYTLTYVIPEHFGYPRIDQQVYPGIKSIDKYTYHSRNDYIKLICK